MFKKILSKKGFPVFTYSIGLGLSEELIIKAGKKGSGINDLIWIGDAVIDASNLSSIGNKDGFEPIVMDFCFYENIRQVDASSKNKYGDWINKKYSTSLGVYVYHTNIVKTAFNDWVAEKL